MKGILVILLLCISPCFGDVAVSYLGVKKKGVKNLLSLEVFNGSQKEVKAVRGTFIFKDNQGKVVDVKSSWIHGGGVSKSAVIKKMKRKKCNLVVTVRKEYASIEVLPTKVIMNDGTVSVPKLRTKLPKSQEGSKK